MSDEFNGRKFIFGVSFRIVGALEIDGMRLVSNGFFIPANDKQEAITKGRRKLFGDSRGRFGPNTKVNLSKVSLHKINPRYMGH